MQISRDELMKMAREAKFEVGGAFIAMDAAGLEDLASSILEFAAEKFNQPHQEYFGHEIQEEIRALKPKADDA